ncbi:hypothetical protein ACOSP7_031232 [Xanthoceras sorbifolium]
MTRIVDNAIKRASVGEVSTDKASTSGAVAPMIGGGFLPVGLNLEIVLTDSDLTKSFAWNEVVRLGCCFEAMTCGRRLGPPLAIVANDSPMLKLIKSYQLTE